MSGLYAQFPDNNRMPRNNGDVIIDRNAQGNQGGSGSPPGGSNNPPLPGDRHLQRYPLDRFPSMHQLDASVSWKLPKSDRRNWSMIVGLSLVNVYNQRNLIDQVERRQQSNQNVYEDRIGIGFAPNLMLSIEW